MAVNEAQQAILDKARARRQGGGEGQAPVEPQRMRMMAQGLTFGFADELEAMVESALSGEKTYEDAVKEVRQKIKAYKQENPMSALGYEALGALPTALIGGAPATLGRLAVRGGVEGGLAGMGSAEGGVTNRLAAARFLTSDAVFFVYE